MESPARRWATQYVNAGKTIGSEYNNGRKGVKNRRATAMFIRGGALVAYRPLIIRPRLLNLSSMNPLRNPDTAGARLPIDRHVLECALVNRNKQTGRPRFGPPFFHTEFGIKRRKAIDKARFALSQACLIVMSDGRVSVVSSA